MTVNTHLKRISSELVLSEYEKTNIGSSISTLSSRLDRYFDIGVISEKFQFGSSTRGTILPRKADSNSDIDYMIVFNSNGETRKPQTYIDRLKRFAELKYSTSEIHQSSPTVVLTLQHIKFELVPAIYNYGYHIPSPASHWCEWITTDPQAVDNALQSKNKSEEYNIKPLIRLIKYWNAKQGHPYSSFELEQYIINSYYLLCDSLKDYYYYFWRNFNCTYDTPQYIIDKVNRAKRIAAQAQQYEHDNKPISAEDEIKKMVPEL